MNVNADKIKIFIAKKETTQSQVSKSAGISQPHFSDILRRGTCQSKTAGKIARALGVDVLDILEVTE